MPRFKFHVSVFGIAATIVFAMAAAPAGAGIVPGGDSGADSFLPGDPLGPLDDPLNPVLPGDEDLGDQLDESLGNVPGLAAPKPTAKPSPATNGPTSSAPKSAAPRTKAPARRVSRPGRTSGSNSSSDATRATRKSSDGPSGPFGAARTARKQQNYDRDAFNRPSRRSEPAGPGPAAPNSFVGSVVDRIPPQYRWPVLVLACLAILFAFTSMRERRRSVRVERAALVDSLTGLPNRPAFERRLAKEWRRSERYNRPLGMLLIDLDDFKQVNDTQGHAAGDAVLREVAEAISGRIRVSDMAARLGGDEFVVICPETPLEGLKILASSLEERLQEAAIAISVGFTEREPADKDPDHFIERADAAMYRRKQSTRRHSDRRADPLASPMPLVAAAAD
jgi:diguanylate cyclase (GGDEF)-like protein